jgi:hypothetical protein
MPRILELADRVVAGDPSTNFIIMTKFSAEMDQIVSKIHPA